MEQFTDSHPSWAELLASSEGMAVLHLEHLASLWATFVSSTAHSFHQNLGADMSGIEWMMRTISESHGVSGSLRGLLLPSIPGRSARIGGLAGQVVAISLRNTPLIPIVLIVCILDLCPMDRRHISDPSQPVSSWQFINVRSCSYIFIHSGR